MSDLFKRLRDNGNSLDIEEAINRIEELEKEFGKGKWVWGEVFSHDHTVEDHPENPNWLCFTKVWLPDDENN